jgi:hypothetical protein
MAAREPEMGLTFEKVWAMFQESDRRHGENRRAGGVHSQSMVAAAL